MGSRLLRLCLIGLAAYLATHLCRELYFADVKPVSLVEDTEAGWRLDVAVSLVAVE